MQNPDATNPVEVLFLRALEIPVTDREAFLGEECVDNPELIAEVQQLLAAHEQTGSFVVDRQAEWTQAPTSSMAIGSRIGAYTLREKIGEGGMGEVYVAEQEKPIARKVAWKVIKPGMDSKAVLARFEAEQQALAMMNHRNIAKVLDAGMSPSGSPYFVMELVAGMPITDYCDEKKLTIEERLELFLQVCRAIQHAHQKGIIHRDIKPSNVLVTEEDGQAIPKVIDFGVAKALSQKLTDRTLYTNFQGFLGTPLYASPEQASLSNVDVDTRSDVYSLGILLYELVTGSTPYNKEELQKAAYEEMCRIIREQEAPRPSNRLTTLGQSVSTISERRRCDPSRLIQSVRGDLDWIVMKALEKDRGRRYEGPNALAQDIERMLGSEMVEARPPTYVYRIKKLVSRHRQLAALFSVASCGVALLVMILLYNYYSQRELVEQLASKNNELLHERFVEVFELVESGDLDTANAELNDLRSMSSDHERIRKYQNLVNLFGSIEQRANALEDLRQRSDSEDDLTSRAMFVLGLIETGREWQYWDHVDSLNSYSPTTFEERLLRGAANIFGQPQRALKDLKLAVHEKPSSAVAHVLLSQAIQLETVNIELPRLEFQSKALTAYEEALVGVYTSKPTNVNAIAAFLDAHYSLYIAHQEKSPSWLQARWLASWEEALERSFELQYDPSIHRAQLDALLVLRQFEPELVPEFEGRIFHIPNDSNGIGEVIPKLIQYAMLTGELPKASELARKYKSEIMDYDVRCFLPLVCEAIQQHGLEEAQKLVKELVAEEKHPITRAGDWFLLKIVGEDDQAVKYAEEYREYCMEKTPTIEQAERVAFVAQWMCGRAKDKELEAFIENERHLDPKTQGQFRLAVHYLCKNEREKAVDLFQKLAATPTGRWFGQGWGNILLKHLEDEKFLPCLADIHPEI